MLVLVSSLTLTRNSDAATVERHAVYEIGVRPRPFVLGSVFWERVWRGKQKTKSIICLCGYMFTTLAKCYCSSEWILIVIG